MSRSTHVAAVACLVALAGASSVARADTIIRSPNPPQYHLELEPKLNLNYFLFENYGGSAIGPGVRASIPLMSPGFIRTINDSIAITFGLDLMRYSGSSYYGWTGYCNGNPKNCPGWYAGYETSFWALMFPVAMQWNFFLTDRWSVFGEPGVTLRYAFYPDYAWCAPGYDPRFGPCTPDRTSAYLTIYGGARFKFTDAVALTMRIGHPTTFSIGVSLFF